MTPKLRFPQFTDTWQTKKLTDLFDVRDGTHESPIYVEAGKPLVTSKNLNTDGTLDLNNVSYISENDFDSINKRSKVDIGDILFGMIGTIGNPVRVKSNDFAIKNVALIKPRSVDTLYLIQYLRSPIILQQFHQKNSGGTQKFIALGDIRSLDLSVPSKPEQQKIASFLSLIDERLNLSEQKLEQLKKYKKGLLQKIFSQRLRFKDDSGKDFPDWEEKKLGEIVTFLRGSLLSKADIKSDGKFKCIHYGELFTEYSEVINEVKSRTDINTGTESKIGDILMPTSDVTPQGLAKASTINESNVMLGGDINILRPNNDLNSILLSYLINLQKKKIMRLVAGATIRHIYGKDLAKIYYKLPVSNEEQQRIADFLSLVDDKISLEEKKLEQAKQYKKGLLQRMFV